MYKLLVVLEYTQCWSLSLTLLRHKSQNYKDGLEPVITSAREPEVVEIVFDLSEGKTITLANLFTDSFCIES